MMQTIPIIDIGPLRDAASDRRGEVAREIRRASMATGFFYIANHGIPDGAVAEILGEAKRFFEQPLELKESVSIATNEIYRGYTKLYGQTLDAQTGGDLKESMYLGVDLPLDHPLVRAGTPSHGPNRWPDWLPGWRQSTLEYFAAMAELSHLLMDGIALSLGLPWGYFEESIDQHMSALRLLRYPPHPTADPEREVGCGAHTDWGAVTILAQDQTGGLEIRLASGEWIAAEPAPGTFVINMGDMMARWTNDIYTSTPHRVLNRCASDRYSAAFFFDPNFDAPIACLPSCASPERPPRYAPTTAGAHHSEMQRKAYGAGA
jgi:isopenicillin N synthase-like dioxygenase